MSVWSICASGALSPLALAGNPIMKRRPAFTFALIVLAKNPSKVLFRSPQRLLCVSSLTRVILETDLRGDLGEGGGREKRGGAGTNSHRH